MEFRTDISELLKGKAIKRFGKNNDAESECFIAKILPANVRNYGIEDTLSTVIDKMGDASSFAQGIHIPITSASSFRTSDYVLYLKVQGKKCYGLIKTGYKNLYVREYSSSAMINIKPLCILDFYVHESCQRAGHGKDLFDCVIEDEKIEPKMLAYDRPSHKFLSFLRKNCNLYDYFPQNNNFVVFNEYFEKLNAENKAKRLARQEASYDHRQYFNPYGTSSEIGMKQRRGQGVFSALGSQMIQRTDSVKNSRGYSAYDKFQQPHSKNTPGYSQANFHKTPGLVETKPTRFVRQNTYGQEETKKTPIARDSRYTNKFEQFKQKSYITPDMIGMQNQTAAVPQKSRHMMRFCLGEKDNKLLKRNVETTDHLDMYTSKVNHTNARVNFDMQSKRAIKSNPYPGSSNLLVERHGRDNLIRAPFMWQ